MASEIGLERCSELFGPGLFYGFLVLGLRCRDLYPPLRTMANESVIQHEPRKVAQAELTGRQYPNDQSVTVEDCTLKDGAAARSLSTFCPGYEVEAEIEQDL